MISVDVVLVACSSKSSFLQRNHRISSEIVFCGNTTGELERPRDDGDEDGTRKLESNRFLKSAKQKLAMYENTLSA